MNLGLLEQSHVSGVTTLQSKICGDGKTQVTRSRMKFAFAKHATDGHWGGMRWRKPNEWGKKRMLKIKFVRVLPRTDALNPAKWSTIGIAGGPSANKIFMNFLQALSAWRFCLQWIKHSWRLYLPVCPARLHSTIWWFKLIWQRMPNRKEHLRSSQSLWSLVWEMFWRCSLHGQTIFVKTVKRWTRNLFGNGATSWTMLVFYIVIDEWRLLIAILLLVYRSCMKDDHNYCLDCSAEFAILRQTTLSRFIQI